MKKVAFFRQTNPFPFGIAIRAINKLKSLIARNAPVMAAIGIVTS